MLRTSEYFIGNALIFFFVFQPLLGREWLPIPALELLVVLLGFEPGKIISTRQANHVPPSMLYAVILPETNGIAAAFLLGFPLGQ
jgi:hypothetical protein